MGQAKHKKQFFDAAERLLAQLGALAALSTGAADPQRDALVLQLCELTQDRWVNPADSEGAALFKRALDHRQATVQVGLQRFLDVLLGYIWPAESTEHPDLDLFVALPCQVLPLLGDVIGDFDEVQALQDRLTARLERHPSQAFVGATVQLDHGLFDVNPHDGWPVVRVAVSTAKSPQAARANGPRQGFRFSDSPAAAPVARTMFARLSFQTPEQLQAAARALAEPWDFELDAGTVGAVPEAPVPYTLKSVLKQESDTYLAGVRLLAMGLPMTTLTRWAFYEGEQELRAALRNLRDRHGLAPADLRARVAVVEQPGVALPEGVMGADAAAATMGKSDPQVQVLFARQSQPDAVSKGTPNLQLSATVTLGRSLFARANSQNLQATVQAAVQALGAAGVRQVELGKVSKRT